MNAAKKKLGEGGLVLCMGLRQAHTVDIAMIAAEAGFDALYVDLQHSPLSLETASTICAGSIGLGITPLVRPPSHAPDAISRVLDGGAQGVVIPDVDTAQEAQAVVSAARFPPIGRRSVGGSGPALRYKALKLGEVNRMLNEQTLVVVMLETAEGIANADAIARTPGIDVLLIGSNDLCTSMGIPGELRHPKLREAYDAVARACKAHGKTLGVGGIRGDLELQGDLLRLGARFVIAGNDVAYLAAAARKDAEALRGIRL
jgi:2-keto-3-deoxy-L-rhamnonate aldolase RhmA